MRPKNIARWYLIISFVIALTAPFFIPAHALEQIGITSIVDVKFPCPPGASVGVLGECSGDTPSPDFDLYIRRFYQFAAGIAGILAVGMIVVGSYFYSISGVVDKKSEGKKMIVSALWGIVLLFGSYLILNTINPQIVQLKKPDMEKLEMNLCKKGEIASGTITVDGETKPNCIPIVDLSGPSACKKFSEIPVLAGGSMFTGSGDQNSGELKCGKRRVGIKDEVRIDDNLGIDSDGDFYNYYEIDEEIDASEAESARLWLYPYYRQELGTDSARCLIYAYKESGMEVVMTELNMNLKLCDSQPQEDTEASSTATAQEEQGECSSCVEITSNDVPLKSTACKGTSCKVNENLLEKLKNLNAAMTNGTWRVTEVWPPTVKHKDKCHYNGTCADIALTSSPALTAGGCDKIQKFINNAAGSGLTVVNEYYQFAGNICNPKLNPKPAKYDTTTGGHLHVEM